MKLIIVTAFVAVVFSTAFGQVIVPEPGTIDDAAFSKTWKLLPVDKGLSQYASKIKLALVPVRGVERFALVMPVSRENAWFRVSITRKGKSLGPAVHWLTQPGQKPKANEHTLSILPGPATHYKDCTITVHPHDKKASKTYRSAKDLSLPTNKAIKLKTVEDKIFT